MESIKTNESLAQKITKAQSALENVTVSAEEAEDGQGPSGLQGKSELGLANPGRWGCGCNSHSGHPQPMNTGASTSKPSTAGSNVSDPEPAGENDIMKEHLYVTRRLIDVIERHCDRLFRLEEKVLGSLSVFYVTADEDSQDSNASSRSKSEDEI